MKIIPNVDDRRHAWIGSWEVEPLVYENLGPEHVGKTVIYRDSIGRASAGTISSWRDGIVFARYGRGDTAAGTKASNLMLAIRTNDPTNPARDSEATHTPGIET